MKHIIQYAVRGFLSFAFLALSSTAQADNTDFKAFYVFGDSLSDTGNDFRLTSGAVPPTVNYYNGRFSNGPVAFEYFWQAMRNNQATLKPSSLEKVNYASDKAVSFSFGGATTEISNLTPGEFPVDGLVGQVNNFIQIVKTKGIHLNNKTLYALWAGANDYLLPPSLLANSIKNPSCQAAPKPTVCNITTAIENLYSSIGARYFLVPNLPNLGSLPIVNNPAFYDPSLSESFKQLTITHNTSLNSALEQLRQRLPDIHIIYIDVYSLFNTLIQTFPHGSDAGPAGYCLFIDVTTCTVPLNGFDAPGYVFWDGEHPTTAAYRILAMAMVIAVQNYK